MRSNFSNSYPGFTKGLPPHDERKLRWNFVVGE